MQETENAIYMEPEEYEEYLNKLSAQVKEVENATTHSAPSLSLYEMNQQLMAQMPNLDYEEAWSKASDELEIWLDKQLRCGEYYMLLCKELSYYTIFHLNWEQGDTVLNFKNEFADVITELGGIKAVQEDTNGALAVWADWQNEGEAHCFYLFSYDQGVIDI